MHLEIIHLNSIAFFIAIAQSEAIGTGYRYMEEEIIDCSNHICSRRCIEDSYSEPQPSAETPYLLWFIFAFTALNCAKTIIELISLTPKKQSHQKLHPSPMLTETAAEDEETSDIAEHTQPAAIQDIYQSITTQVTKTANKAVEQLQISLLPRPAFNHSPYLTWMLSLAAPSINVYAPNTFSYYAHLLPFNKVDEIINYRLRSTLLNLRAEALPIAETYKTYLRTHTTTNPFITNNYLYQVIENQWKVVIGETLYITLLSKLPSELDILSLIAAPTIKEVSHALLDWHSYTCHGSYSTSFNPVGFRKSSDSQALLFLMAILVNIMYPCDTNFKKLQELQQLHCSNHTLERPEISEASDETGEESNQEEISFSKFLHQFALALLNKAKQTSCSTWVESIEAIQTCLVEKKPISFPIPTIAPDPDTKTEAEALQEEKSPPSTPTSAKRDISETADATSKPERIRSHITTRHTLELYKHLATKSSELMTSIMLQSGTYPGFTLKAYVINYLWAHYSYFLAFLRNDSNKFNSYKLTPTEVLLEDLLPLVFSIIGEEKANQIDINAYKLKALDTLNKIHQANTPTLCETKEKWALHVWNDYFLTWFGYRHSVQQYIICQTIFTLKELALLAYKEHPETRPPRNTNIINVTRAFGWNKKPDENIALEENTPAWQELIELAKQDSQTHYKGSSIPNYW